MAPGLRARQLGSRDRNTDLLIPEQCTRAQVPSPGIFLQCNSWRCPWGGLELANKGPRVESLTAGAGGVTSIYLAGFLKIHLFIHSFTRQTFAKGLFCAGNIAGIVETAVNKTRGPSLADLVSKWEEADNKQRNNKDVCQVVVSAMEGEKKKPEEGTAHNGPREAPLQVVTLEGDPEVRVRGREGTLREGCMAKGREAAGLGWEWGLQVGGAAAEQSRGGCRQGAAGVSGSQAWQRAQ